MRFLGCTLFVCVKKVLLLIFEPNNASVHPGSFAAASEMGFELQGCLNKTEVVVLLGVWGNAGT